MQNIEQIKLDGLNLVQQAIDIKSLEEVRVKFLGKSGEITSILKTLGKLSPEERKEVAQTANSTKNELIKAIDDKKQALELAEINEKLESEKLDLTLPASAYKIGKRHPISYVIEEVETILSKLGFSVASTNEIENEFFNFTALNIPAEHPARQDHDTFYFNDFDEVNGEKQRKLLRTQTSGTQVHAMQAKGAPLRVISAGRTYRSDSDLTHTPQFHQIEGLAIDKNITFADLKGVLQVFLSQFFEKEVNIRFRPNFFPFTEPGVEIDIECVFCEGKGCRVCSHTGFIEILAGGMVHENVLKAGGVDPKEYQGFAFGGGIDRLAMVKYGINDLRLFFDSHIEFMEHFGKTN
ncbi:MAG: phenylalanine--tRNA ligase subunit alpha [Proteobacteria bacterium]|nr:phenylalanine--tRNA ligase subunit alpha [Pseudomonadota bacterium]